MPLLIEKIQLDAYRSLEAKCEELGADMLALGGVEDHVHLLVQLPATLAVADLVKHLKGSSTHLLSQHLYPGQFVKWQGGYGAFSVSIEHLERVRHYIALQCEHHAAGSLVLTWELPASPATATMD